MLPINRREALKLMMAVMGGTIFGAERLLAGATDATAANPESMLSAADCILLNEVGETILPATAGSGGAKAANIAEFMDDIVRNFYNEGERATFTGGLSLLQAACRQTFSGRDFLSLTPVESREFILSLDQAKPQADYYRMIKQLTLWGYFTSEIGCTQAMAHVAIPGRYDGIVTISPGTKAWSE